MCKKGAVGFPPGRQKWQGPISLSACLVQNYVVLGGKKKKKSMHN